MAAKSRARRRRASPQKRNQGIAPASEVTPTPTSAGRSSKAGDEVARGIAALIAGDRCSISWEAQSKQIDQAKSLDSFSSGRTAHAIFEVSVQAPETSAQPSQDWNDQGERDYIPVSGLRALVDERDTWTLHMELCRCIAALEKVMIAERSNLRLGLRHSNAPDPIARIPFDSKDRRAIDQAVAVLKAQPPQPTTSPADVSAAATKLQMIGERICTHFAIHVDTTVHEEPNAGASDNGKLAALLASWGILACGLVAVAGAARSWIGSTGKCP
jgi:hypothetical protein